MSIGDQRVRSDDRAVAATAPEGIEEDPYDVIHIVDWWQDVMGRVLRLKVPRALCGESLEEDLDRPGPSAGSPSCRRCAELNGNSGYVKRVHRYRVLFEGTRGNR